MQFDKQLRYRQSTIFEKVGRPLYVTLWHKPGRVTDYLPTPYVVCTDWCGGVWRCRRASQSTVYIRRLQRAVHRVTVAGVALGTPRRPGRSRDTNTAARRREAQISQQDRTGHVAQTLTPDTWAEKFERFERINSIRETNENFDSCNSCKRLGTSRLHELRESKFSFVSRIEFIRSKISNFSAHVSGVTANRHETQIPAQRRPRNSIWSTNVGIPKIATQTSSGWRWFVFIAHGAILPLM